MERILTALTWNVAKTLTGLMLQCQHNRDLSKPKLRLQPPELILVYTCPHMRTQVQMTLTWNTLLTSESRNIGIIQITKDLQTVLNNRYFTNVKIKLTCCSINERESPFNSIYGREQSLLWEMMYYYVIWIHPSIHLSPLIPWLGHGVGGGTAYLSHSLGQAGLGPHSHSDLRSD